jgi:MoaA/NifB/PqqE/SkfB family radical SAM enzyme
MKDASWINTLACLAKDRVPGQLVIQITNQCNASCPQCGMRKTADIHRTRLKTDAIRQILDAAGEKGIQAVSFTGGEPLLYLEPVTELISHAGRAGIPYIRTGTNGFLFCGSRQPGFRDRIKAMADKLAATPLRNFWISLDSAVPKVHEQMRGLPDVVRGIEMAIPIFHDAGIFPSVNLGINRLVGGPSTRDLHRKGFSSDTEYLEAFYQGFHDAFYRFFRQVRNMGFTIANTCYPMSIGDSDSDGGLQAVYAATAGEAVVRFTREEKVRLYQALAANVTRHRGHLRIFTPLCALHTLIVRHQASKTSSGQAIETAGCRGGRDYFFISSNDGHTYPCGYRGHEDLGPFPDMNLRDTLQQPICRQCDWECFRDPSELFYPLLDTLHRPQKVLRRVSRDPRFFSLWQKDLRYYAACGYFNGRTPPVVSRMARFSPRTRRKAAKLCSSSQNRL